MDGKIDLSISIQHNAMYDTISKAMSATLMNHNETFIHSISNAIKEAFNLSPKRRGPVYPNSTGGNQRTSHLGEQSSGGQQTVNVPMNNGGNM